MFNTVRLAVSCLMVVGKLSILTVSNTALANDLDNPRFFNYTSSAWSNRLVELSFGWFKTLDHEQKIAYDQAIAHAVMYADNGEVVRWYKKDASGMAMSSATWPSGAGYCRRVHIQAIAYNVEKTMRATACYNGTDNRWTWSN
jgi:surface antigen